MCLAVPGEIVEWLEGEPPFVTAKVRFGGVSRAVSMECVPEAEIGQFVLVHAGIAIGIVDQAEAVRILNTLAELELNEDEPVGE